MQTTGHGLATLDQGSVPAATDIERIAVFLQGRSTDPPAVLRSARSLEARLDRIKKRSTLLGRVELSEHLRAILKQATSE